MKNSVTTLVCFTASYPYGEKETYFHTELKYLAEGFERIIIIPKYNPYGNERKRTVPANVTIFPPLVPQGFSRVKKGIVNLSPVSFYFTDFFRQKVYKSRFRIARWAKSFLAFRATYNVVRKFVETENSRLIFYSYWGEAPIFLTKLLKRYPKIIRMHGGDFYLDRNRGYLPLREPIYQHSNLLLPISLDIKHILEDLYLVDKNKIYLNYLGVDNNGVVIDESKWDMPITIVSCSNVIRLKRVHLIIEALSTMPSDVNVEWHHFGDGPELTSLRIAAKDLESNVKCIFHGWTPPPQIFDFYKNHKITWFVNVSKYEGVPVSIMEAFSFSIPAIATNVGGTKEIVNSENGYLLDTKFVAKDLLEQILSVSNKTYKEKRINAYNTWKTKFQAEINYKKMIAMIQRLENNWYNNI